MDSSSLIPFKSKKPVLTTPVKNQPPVAVGPTVITPDRLHNPTRIRNKNFALSLSDVRRTALNLRKSNTVIHGSGFDRLDSQRKRVGSLPEKSKGSEKSPALLPQKYEMLCEFFNAMVSSIRLLRLKRQPATLTMLSRNIESLTDRRFTLHHLGQLKHIVPDIVAVKKIRVHDNETCCMKEDLLVSLEAHEVETDKITKGSGGYSQLKGIFRSRIVDYARSHPETDDVLEGELPDLFYKLKQEPEPSVKETSVVQSTTLTAPSFKRRLSSRAVSAPISEPSLADPLPETPFKESAPGTMDSGVTPVKGVSKTLKFDSTPSKFDSTPLKFASTPARLMAATPGLRTPKRSLITDDGLPNKLAKRRSLKFEEHDDDAEEEQHACQDGNSAASNDLVDILPENLLHSLMEKERKSLEEQDPILLQAQKRQQLIVGVPKLFDIIRLLFQSIRRSVMTKDELIHKILTGHLDVVDKGEVEEMLKLLQEIAPEFITEQTCMSGDTLLRLNKLSCADTIRAKLLDAK